MVVVKPLVSAAALLSALLLVGSVQSFSTLVPLQRTIRGFGPLCVTTRESTTTTTTSQVANELLGLLIDHAKTKGVATQDKRIEKFMKSLIEAKVDFEPSECLFGQPLFAVAYQYGPKPFWVKYSQWVPSGKDLNIQGQQFFATDDGPEDQENLRFINYGEFFGNGTTTPLFDLHVPHLIFLFLLSCHGVCFVCVCAHTIKSRDNTGGGCWLPQVNRNPGATTTRRRRGTILGARWVFGILVWRQKTTRRYQDDDNLLHYVRNVSGGLQCAGNGGLCPGLEQPH